MDKYVSLIKALKTKGSVLIAYSGGVDSSLLLKAVKDAEIEAYAITVATELIPLEESTKATAVLERLGIRHRVECLDILKEDCFVSNPRDRCYHCKCIIMGRLKELAKAFGLACVIEGSNVDDLKDWRPGMMALKELGILSPLLEVGLGKAEIRATSKALGLDSWDKPSSPCLATRFYYGCSITKEALQKVYMAERYIIDKGFTNVRVRTNGTDASIEVDPSEVQALMGSGMREDIINRLLDIGFVHINIDPEGYRIGRLNTL